MYEAGEEVVWLRASARGRRHDHLVAARVLRDDGAGRVRVEARLANSRPARRWVRADRLRPLRWLDEQARRSA